MSELDALVMHYLSFGSAVAPISAVTAKAIAVTSYQPAVNAHKMRHAITDTKNSTNNVILIHFSAFLFMILIYGLAFALVAITAKLICANGAQRNERQMERLVSHFL